MLKSLVIAGLILVGASAQAADWAGDWKGSFDYSADDGTKETGDLNVVIADDGQTFKFSENYWGAEFELAINNGVLTYNGTEVGTYSETAISIKATDSDCTQTYELSRTDAGFHYVDDYRCTDGYFDHVEADLAIAVAN